MYYKLAWRNLWRNHRRTLITVSSVMFAVILSLFLVSMNRGSHNHMIDITARFHTGYLQIQHPRYDDEPSLDNSITFTDDFANEILNANSNIDYIVPRIETFMLAAGEDQTLGSMVLGIDPDREQQLNQLKDRLVSGNFFNRDKETAVIGEGLANRLNIAVGDTLILLGQGRFGMTAAGAYPVSGLINHPIRDMENQIVYLSLPVAQWLLSSEDQVTNILVTPNNLSYTDSIADSLRAIGDEDLVVLTWSELMPELLEGLEIDRIQQYLMMGILYIVIGFGLFGTILTMTLERMKEFGLLLSVGMKRFQLSGVIFMETLMICLLGVVTGSIAGLPILYYFHLNPIELGGDMADIMQDMGFEAVLPFYLQADIFLLQGTIIFVLAFVISLYPTIKIMSLDIMEASKR